jgi:Ca-activated chloride channel homolog
MLFADPNFINIKEKIKKDGIDIVIALDISKSMEANDLKPNRISAAKQVIGDFVEEIWSDRLWLVVFAGKPYSSIPLTYDYRLISEVVNNLSTDTLNQNISGLDGTAIWDALLLSSTILEWEISQEEINEENSREKIIILLTDWDANRWVDPILAVEALKTQSIKTYTIWVGSEEWWTITIQNWPFTQTQQIAPLNESTLREIASISNWKFFRATDNNSLEDIFLEISKLETTEIETEIEKNYTTAYEPFLYMLLVLLWLLFTLQYSYKL